jgi:methylmalonyl-CoA carboxyltransferase 5S subunit
MFPQVAAKFFATREQGPKNLGKDPAKAAAAAVAAAPAHPAGNGNGVAREPVTYEVKLNGNTHKVTVATI